MTMDPSQPPQAAAPLSLSKRVDLKDATLTSRTKEEAASRHVTHPSSARTDVRAKQLPKASVRVHPHAARIVNEETLQRRQAAGVHELELPGALGLGLTADRALFF